MNSNRLLYISYLRVIVTFLVVLFHSFVPYFYEVGESLSYPYIQQYKDIFIDEERIQMPLFTFISGYLFQYLYQNGKYQNWKELINNKVKRLLFPYFIFGIILYVLIPVEIHQTISPWNAFLHLWFLLMLFWCFLFQFAIRKIDNLWLTVAFSFILWILHRQIPSILCFGAFMQLFIYFHLGYNYEKLVRLIKIDSWIYLFVFVIMSVLCVYFDKSWGRSIAFKAAYYIIYVLTSASVLMFSLQFTSSLPLKGTKLLLFLDRRSLGVYIFHYWLMMWVIYDEAIMDFATRHWIIYPWLMFLFLSLISLLVTHLLLKTKLAKII